MCRPILNRRLSRELKVGAPLAVVERVAVEPLAARQHHREAQLELADGAFRGLSFRMIFTITSRHFDGGGWLWRSLTRTTVTSFDSSRR